MEIICFGLSQIDCYGAAFYDFLKLRKQFFVDHLAWDIAHDDEVEMDQYDNPTARYCLVIKDGQVVAGARVLPCTARWGEHSYMLRDAVAGKLRGIPADILPLAPVSSDIWELTRVVVSDRLRGRSERAKCLAMLLRAASRTAAEQGATHLISLSPIALERFVRQLGFDIARIAQGYRDASDQRRYVCLTMPVEDQGRAPPASYAPRKMREPITVEVPGPAPQTAQAGQAGPRMQNGAAKAR